MALLQAMFMPVFTVNAKLIAGLFLLPFMLIKISADRESVRSYMKILKSDLSSLESKTS